jgi:hypothetical protein
VINKETKETERMEGHREEEDLVGQEEIEENKAKKAKERETLIPGTTMTERNTSQSS